MSVVEDFNQQVIVEFRANGGKVGGMFAGAPLHLLHTTGAKTGRELVSPLVYHAEGNRLLIFASKGGSDVNPAWYHNLVAHPDVIVEFGSETMPMRATVITGPERDRLFAEQVERAPGFGDYQRKTSRIIPIIALDRA
jgi:deazaflavin-dependent oxidoreductase (nitroreductase family)